MTYSINSVNLSDSAKYTLVSAQSNSLSSTTMKTDSTQLTLDYSMLPKFQKLASEKVQVTRKLNNKRKLPESRIQKKAGKRNGKANGAKKSRTKIEKRYKFKTS